MQTDSKIHARRLGILAKETKCTIKDVIMSADINLAVRVLEGKGK